MKRAIAIIVLVIIGLALFAFTKPPATLTGPVPAQAPGAVNLPDLGVSITLPEGLQGLAAGTSTVPGIGTVLSVAIPASATGGAPCELGAFYDVAKADIGTDSPWDEAQLKEAAATQGNVPPQAKEFPDFYLVFEPSQATCSTDPKELKIETAVRQSLWLSVSTATLLPQ